jgi:hypothetical protein
VIGVDLAKYARPKGRAAGEGGGCALTVWAGAEGRQSRAERWIRGIQVVLKSFGLGFLWREPIKARARVRVLSCGWRSLFGETGEIAEKIPTAKQPGLTKKYLTSNPHLSDSHYCGPCQAPKFDPSLAAFNAGDVGNSVR